jgi:hypothetical protein
MNGLHMSSLSPFHAPIFFRREHAACLLLLVLYVHCMSALHENSTPPFHEDATHALTQTTHVHSGISVVMAATKWDVFRGRDAEEQRVLGLALRSLAHANGAHLAYLGGLQPGGGAGAEGKHNAGPGGNDDGTHRACVQ